jgi:hypothetical protein
MIAMAGLAEAAWSLSLVISAGGLLISAAFIAISWWKRSIVFGAVACVLLAVLSFLQQPWTAFSSRVTDDPDVHYWIIRYQVVAIVWIFVALTAMATLTIVITRRKPSVTAGRNFRSATIED